MLMSGHDVSLENHTVANTVIAGMIYSDLLHHIFYILRVTHWIYEFSNYLNVCKSLQTCLTKNSSDKLKLHRRTRFEGD